MVSLGYVDLTQCPLARRSSMLRSSGDYQQLAMATFHRALRRIAQRGTQSKGQLRQFSSTSESQPVLQKRLDGKVAIITGAAGALGAATAKLFASHGAHLILVDRNDEQGEKVAHEIAKTFNASAVYRHCDVAKEADVASAVDFAVKEFGKLDIMHNNAGSLQPAQDFQTLDMDLYDEHTAIMMRGVVLGIKHASRVMVPRKQGAILITASTLSVSIDTGVSLIYNVNKQNLPGLARVAAAHLGRHGIRVNCVSPWAVPTEMSLAWARGQGLDIDMDGIRAAFTSKSPLLGKHCSAEDVALGALYLCSDESHFLSGHNLVLDAGSSSMVDFSIDLPNKGS